MNRNDIEILLVEDDPSDAELTFHALRAANVANQIHLVGDGAEALEFVFGEGRYEGDGPAQALRLMLLDLKLPLVDGLEVLEAVRSDPRTSSTPVVILTSSKEERDIVRSYGLGANSYIVKPVDFEQFMDAVAEIGLYWLLLNEPPAALAPWLTGGGR